MTNTTTQITRQKGIWQRLVEILCRDAPDELGACAFECKKPNCAAGHWETCLRRLRDMDTARPLDPAR